MSQACSCVSTTVSAFFGCLSTWHDLICILLAAIRDMWYIVYEHVLFRNGGGKIMHTLLRFSAFGYIFLSPVPGWEHMDRLDRSLLGMLWQLKSWLGLNVQKINAKLRGGAVHVQKKRWEMCRWSLWFCNMEIFASTNRWYIMYLYK